MRSLLTVIFLATSAILAGNALAQGTQDNTGPRPPYQSSGATLPSNTSPPVRNRQSNIFSPGAPTPRLRPIYPRGGHASLA